MVMRGVQFSQGSRLWCFEHYETRTGPGGVTKGLAATIEVAQRSLE
jgi:hypothetical protein